MEVPVEYHACHSLHHHRTTYQSPLPMSYHPYSPSLKCDKSPPPNSGGGGGGRDTSYWLFLFLFTATWRRNGRKRELGADGSRSCSGGGWGGGWICTEKVQQRNLTCGELAGTGSAETGKPILFNMNSDTEIILPSNFYLIGCKVNTRV